MLVIYGYHPEEPLAEKIGENLSEMYLPNVEIIRFRPCCMPKNIHWLTEEEQIKIELKGRKELKDHIKRKYERVGFVLDLHEYPMLVKDCAMYHLFFPAWNLELERILKQFATFYEKGNVLVVGHHPWGFLTYHSATVEFYSKVVRKGRLRTLTEHEGVKFTLNLIDYLIKNYLA